MPRPWVVVGGGIVGLAVARALRARFPDRPLTVLEKESRPGAHQTGHNSGVVHSGIYYRPGSLKARLTVDGHDRLVRYLRERQLPYESCGKLIVAAEPSELPALRELQRRAAANGVPGVTWLEGDRIPEHEPNARGVAALWVPGTGIADYRRVAEEYARDLATSGTELRLGRRVTGGQATAAGVTVETDQGPVETEFLVNCAGLQSDRIARACGIVPPVSIVPFRGEYYRLREPPGGLVRGLVYPVPDPAFPFLGVHFTRRIDGGLEAGPNAVWALAREGYRRRDVEVRDVAAALLDPGFLRVVRAHLGVGVYENYRSLDRHRFARDLQRLVPSVGPDDLLPGGAGVRAQAVAPDGRLVDDFVVVEGKRSLHVLNAPSPAATASLSIGDHVAGLVRPP